MSVHASDDEAWRDLANCRGVETDLFYPDRGGFEHGAIEVCKGCVVRQQCLDYALETKERFGVWGGTSERQRKRIRRRGAGCNWDTDDTAGTGAA